MRMESLTTTNKYGQTITLPPQSDTKGMQQIAAILDEHGISSEKEFCFDETSFRRMKFDFAVMRDGKPKLLIEYDGRVHYEAKYFRNVGNRPERNQAHLVKRAIADLRKNEVAAHFGVPLLRISYFDDIPRDRILLWVYRYVDGGELHANDEVAMLDLLETYGFDFPYVPPSKPTKVEQKRIQIMTGGNENA